jgi:quercetin dioxygenase-like cupin family protein
MELAPGVFVSHTATEEWEFDPEVNGDLHLLCSVDGVESGMSRFAGAEVGKPVTYTPPRRETLLVLEGAARVEISGGPTLELRPGVMASIPGGTETTWHLTPPFKEFWVIAG